MGRTTHRITHSGFKGGVASQRVHRIATPLCLPNNCKWDSRSGQFTKTGTKRDSLYVVQEALQNLRTVKGPVCVVSIAGPYRKGKSWVLSQAFNQPEVFPLGHEMVAETMGIWLWIVPEKYRDSKGRDFTVVLLDSEGIDAATGEGLDDNQIFTLTVLLASVLIYNSQGVPTRRDLEGLDFIVKLTHRIEMRSTTTRETRKGHRDSEYFHKTFPYFIWLLRDVTQTIPSDCSNIKEYFLKKVFKVQDSSVVAQEGQKVAESILSLFPGFEAFTLPSPTVNPEMMKSINDNKEDINPLFFTGLEEFKRLLWSVLVPKNSFNDGEVVTGEGLAALVEQYVLAINTPGVIRNVQNAWDSFVEAKCSDTLKDALDAYEVAMTTQLKDKLPCNNDQLRRSHDVALQNSENHFMADTAGISINTIEKYLKKLKELLGERFNLWQIKNATSTREFCNDLLIQLKQAHLDPVLQQLRGEGGAKLSFDDIIGGYKRIKDEYDKSAIGAKDVIAAVFFEFHPMEMLSEKQREERQKFREQMDSELRVQREQLNNMMEANMEQAQQERERFMQENEELKNQFLAVQKTNEENMKMIEKLSDLVAKQDEEKRRLDEQMAMERAKQAELSKRQELLQRMEARHRDEKEKLRREMEAKMEAQRSALTEKYRKAADDRMEAMQHMQERIQDVEEQLEEVKKPGFIERVVKKVKEFGGAVVDKVKENCSVM